MAGWLPDLDVFPELTAARAEYLRLRDVWSAAGQRQRDLEAQIEASKEQRKASLRDAILAGDDGPQAEGDAEKLTAELAEAKEHTHAASSAFLSHINSTIALVIEHRQEWLGAITAFNDASTTKSRRCWRRPASFATGSATTGGCSIGFTARR